MRDACFYGVLIACAAGFALVVVPAGIDLPGEVAQAGLSPRFLPYVLTFLIVALAVAGLLQSLLRHRQRAALPPSPRPVTEAHSAAASLWRPAAVLVLLALSYPLSLSLGLPLASALLCALLLLLGRERLAWAYPAVAVLLPVMVTVFFHTLLHVPLPLGPVEMWLQ